MKHLEFKDKYRKLLLDGKKRATIRLYTNLKPGDEVFVHCGGKIIGVAEIEDVQEKNIDELSEEDAKIDGFESLDDLIREIRSIYGDVDRVCIIKFHLKKFESSVNPHEMYYGDADLMQIAEKALQTLDLNEEERKVLQIFLETGSIRKTAFRLGGIRKRKVIRDLLRKCYSELREKGLL